MVVIDIYQFPNLISDAWTIEHLLYLLNIPVIHPIWLLWVKPAINPSITYWSGIVDGSKFRSCQWYLSDSNWISDAGTTKHQLYLLSISAIHRIWRLWVKPAVNPSITCWASIIDQSKFSGCQWYLSPSKLDFGRMDHRGWTISPKHPGHLSNLAPVGKTSRKPKYHLLGRNHWPNQV